jgi:anti-sigma factor RsiW
MAFLGLSGRRCPTARSLADLANDDLAAERAVPLRAHLRGCPRCRAEYRRWTESRVALQTVVAWPLTAGRSFPGLPADARAHVGAPPRIGQRRRAALVASALIALGLALGLAATRTDGGQKPGARLIEREPVPVMFVRASPEADDRSGLRDLGRRSLPGLLGRDRLELAVLAWGEEPDPAPAGSGRR